MSSPASSEPAASPEPSPTVQPSGWSLDWKFWSGTLIGIAGLVTGYVYYAKTLTYPEVTWWATTQIVFNAQNSNRDIQLRDRNGANIDQNVYAANISVSNSGSALLEKANDVGSLVRSPLQIKIARVDTTKDRVLSASVVDVSQHAPVDLACHLRSDGVDLTWSHFDPETGFRVLLLYSAAAELDADVGINVVGMPQTNHVDLTQRTKQVPQPPATDDLFNWLAFLVGATVLGFVILFGISLLDRLFRAITAGGTFAALNEFGKNNLKPLATEKVLPFLARFGEAVAAPFGLLVRLIIRLWLPAMLAAAIWLAIFYQPVLRGFWQYFFPSTEAPLAIDIPVSNLPCTS
jgi:hypothetical protein